MLRDVINVKLTNRLRFNITKYEVILADLVVLSAALNNIVDENNETVDDIRKIEASETLIRKEPAPPARATKLLRFDTDFSSASSLVNMKPLRAMPLAPSTRKAALRYQSRVLYQMRRYKIELSIITRRLNNATRSLSLARSNNSDSVDTFEIVVNRYLAQM
jgi:hypothetical protein